MLEAKESKERESKSFHAAHTIELDTRAGETEMLRKFEGMCQDSIWKSKFSGD